MYVLVLPLRLRLLLGDSGASCSTSSADHNILMPSNSTPSALPSGKLTVKAIENDPVESGFSQLENGDIFP